MQSNGSINNGDELEAVMVMQTIIQRYGMDILWEEKRFISLFKDFAPELIIEARLLKRAYEEDGISVIKASIAGDEKEQRRSCKLFKKHLVEDIMLAELMADKLVLWYATVLGWNKALCEETLLQSYYSFSKAENDGQSEDGNSGSRSENRVAETEPSTAQSDNTEPSTAQKANMEPSGAEEYAIGCEYYFGNNREQNFHKAAMYMRAAADKGHAAAQFSLACIYKAGKGEVNSSEDAVYWMKKSADNGFAPAQFRLGSFYEEGYGVRMNKVMAAYLYQKAADQDHAEAMLRLGILYSDPTYQECDFDTSVYWYREAAEHGNTDAQFYLGCIYAEGIGLAQNSSIASFWYRKAAETTNGAILHALGDRYFDGIGVKKDFSMAFHCYSRAQQAGEKGLEANLAKCRKKIKFKHRS